MPVPIAGPGLSGMVGGVHARAATAATGGGRMPGHATCRSAQRTTTGTGTACALRWTWKRAKLGWHSAPRRAWAEGDIASLEAQLARVEQRLLMGGPSSVHSRSLPAALHQALVSLLIGRNRRPETRARSAPQPVRKQICPQCSGGVWHGPPQNPGPSGPPHPLRLPLLERGEGLSPSPCYPLPSLLPCGGGIGRPSGSLAALRPPRPNRQF